VGTDRLGRWHGWLGSVAVGVLTRLPRRSLLVVFVLQELARLGEAEEDSVDGKFIVASVIGDLNNGLHGVAVMAQKVDDEIGVYHAMGTSGR
jgi:hypothetical protein